MGHNRNLPVLIAHVQLRNINTDIISISHSMGARWRLKADDGREQIFVMEYIPVAPGRLLQLIEAE